MNIFDFIYIFASNNPLKKMKPIIDFKPPTEEQITLIQPNNITFGSYSFSQWQENILTLIQEALQKHMSKEKEFNRDLFGQPYVTIRCGEAAGEKHKNLVIIESKKMMKILFSFKWVHPQIHKTIETTGVLITNVHDVRGTDTITITLNPWAIPFLLYYGVGVGLTKYDKLTALSLPGKYTKRIYKILCSKAGYRNEYFYEIEDFKKDFELNPNTPWGEIKRTIIEPAKKSIFQAGMSIYFDYDVITQKNGKTKSAAKTIVFKIVNQQTKTEKLVKDRDREMYVYNWLLNAYKEWDKPQSNQKARKYADKLMEDDEMMEQVERRIQYYDDKITNGEMVKAKAYNSIKKMLREDYGLE
jgi:hypothetical protein